MEKTFIADRSHPFLTPDIKRMLIDGDWVPAASGETFTSIDPSTGAALATVALGGREDVDRAVGAARRALEGGWKSFKPQERQALLLRLADLIERDYDELARLDSLDYGGPISRTAGKKRRHVGLLRYYAGLATSVAGQTIENSILGDYFTCTLKEPIGVVGGIFAWNAPLDMMIWKIAPALATGCAVVIKPPTEAALTPLRVGQLLLEAGIPAGVVNIVPGGAEAGAALAEHPGVDKITFTGSSATGQAIVRASAGNLKRVTLELGGKSPDIVFADADLDAAVPGAAMAVFANCGQICSAGTRLFVERPIYEEFVARVADFARKLVVGDSLDPKSDMGPLVSQRQLDRVLSYLEAGRAEGARVVTGAERITGGDFQKGNFVQPTVFGDVRDDMRIAREEIFGPVISAMPFDSVSEVIQRGNDTMFGLGSGVWTRDVSKALRLAREIKAGSVWVNCYQQLDPAVPFGGYKMSGYGRESGQMHLESFLETKAVTIHY